MNSDALDILLVEDSQDDVDLALHTLRREKLANNIFCGPRWRGSPGLSLLSRGIHAPIVRASRPSWCCWI